MKGSQGIAEVGRKSYVYFIRCKQPISSFGKTHLTKFYKIGIASNLDKRLSSLQCGNPFELELVAAILSDDALALEQQLHREYLDSNERREWFALSDFDSRNIIEAMRNQGGMIYASTS